MEILEGGFIRNQSGVVGISRKKTGEGEEGKWLKPTMPFTTKKSAKTMVTRSKSYTFAEYHKPPIAMEIAIVLVLILLNGFFSLSEIALVSSKPSRLEHASSRGSRGAKTALELLKQSENFLSAVQVGITLIGIVTGMYSGISIAGYIAPVFHSFVPLQPYSREIALVITVILTTYVSIVIGELVPKTVALSKPEAVAIRVAPLIKVFSKIFYPVVRILSGSTNAINRLLGIQKQTQHTTEAELRQMLKIASNEGVIGKEQNLIHEKLFYLSDKKAKHIMTHRTDVEWIDITRSDSEIRNALLNAKYNKVICCKKNLDSFVGVIYLRDFHRVAALGKKIAMLDLIVKPTIIPDTTRAKTILELFRSKKTHICIVVDEYGGFAGIITLQDIIENIVGQIPDEGEQYEPDVFVRDDRSVLVSGDAPAETLTELIEGFTIDFEETGYSTVAGFVFHHINKIPQVGDKFKFMGYTIEIVDIDGNKTDKILITKNDKV